MRKPSPKCIACGPDATITDDLDEFNYEAFCAGMEKLEQGGARREERVGALVSVGRCLLAVRMSVRPAVRA
jgi:hypothetical protein